MTLRTLLLPALCLCAATLATAEITITVNSNGGPAYASSTGSLLANNSIIRVGMFNTGGGNLATLQTSNDYNAVNSLFTALAENNGGGGTINQASNPGVDDIVINSSLGNPGSVLGNIEHIQSTYCTAGTQLFVWVFNSADPLNATEWGIFSSSNLVWTFPNDLTQRTLSTFNVDQVIRGTSTGGSTTADQLRLSAISAVPEPAGALLVLTTGLISLRRRRK